jgi:hypothetical protein
MTIEFSDNIYHREYLRKRLIFPLYYCFKPFSWIIKERYCYFDKGMYICEEINDESIRVFVSLKGEIISKELFNMHFKKPSKLRVFLYNHLLWA